MGKIVPCETGVSGNVRLQTELTKEMIDCLEIDKLSKKQYSELKSLLFKFKDVFNDKPGCCKSAMYTINLKNGYVPRQSRPYRIPDNLKPEVDRQITKLLKYGKIIPSVSAYAHPIVLSRSQMAAFECALILDVSMKGP